MKKILIIFGTRPEAIKLAPIIAELKKHPETFSPVVCTTGQHREMLNQVLSLFKIIPEYNLDIMTDNQNLSATSATVITQTQNLLRREKPDLVIVQGDTLTSFASTLAAFYDKVRIAHIEAGLRTYDNSNPYPEEAYRRMITILADYHFAPTPQSKMNLIREGVARENIWVTGNSGIDAFLNILQKLKQPGYDSALRQWLMDVCNVDLRNNQFRYVLVTGHRRENFEIGLKSICSAIRVLANRHGHIYFIYVVHLNPSVQYSVKNYLKDSANGNSNIKLFDPLDYERFVFLLQNADLILTDSGGIQEEVPYLGKPVLVLRNTTERPEGMISGNAKIVGTHERRIVSEAQKLLNDKEAYQQMCKVSTPYGIGNASERIVSIISGLVEQVSRPEGLELKQGSSCYAYQAHK